jgi:two-component system nitrogen regulation sensor histidine kinase GlnL
MIGPIIFPPLFLHFITSFLDQVEENRTILICSYIAVVLLAVADATPWFVAKVEPLMFFKFWPIAGPLYAPFLFLFFTTVFYCFYLLYEDMKKNRGGRRKQELYILWGSLICLAGGSTNFPLWYRIPIPPLGNALTFLFPLLLTYAIFRYDFLSFPLTLRRSLVYSTIIAISTATYLSALVILSMFVQQLTLPYHILLTLAIIFILTLGLQPIRTRAQKFIDSFFFPKQLQYPDALVEASSLLKNFADLPSAISRVNQVIFESLRAYGSSIFLYDAQGQAFVCKTFTGIFKRHEGLEIPAKSSVIKYIAASKNLLIKEILKNSIADKNQEEEVKDACQKLNAFEIEVAVPCKKDQELIGFICLSEKIGSDIFSEEDLNLLTAIADQLVITIDNAALLEKEKAAAVKISTLEIQAKTERLVSMTQMTVSLSHEINNPLTTVILNVQAVLEQSQQGKCGADFIAEQLEPAKKEAIRIKDLMKKLENLTETTVSDVVDYLPGTKMIEI